MQKISIRICSVLLAFLFSGASLSAQNALKPLLTQNHIDALVANYKSIEADFELLNEKYEDFDLEDPDARETFTGSAAYKEYLEILTRNGLGKENPQEVLVTIIQGYTIALTEIQIQSLPEEYQKEIQAELNNYAAAIAPQDTALVKKNYEKLSTIFNE